ncbi:unnamed protein product [Adineta steineri]|uniref:Uncharacterized protein n=1 Tax=Adineta steineri TaxID=433720 RepID=A0A819QCE0_9BILA|nr:unnamed protein product [Adineta steineri]CAF4032955.1 unnamed protein product [Adineta steineri]
MRTSRQLKNQESLESSDTKTPQFQTTEDVKQPKNEQSSSQCERIRRSWTDDSPTTFVPGSTPCRTPFELFENINRIDNIAKEENETISIKIMLISPTILQSIKVETISCQTTFTFQQLVRQQLSAYVKDELQYKYIVSVLVDNIILTDFTQKLGNTKAIEDDVIVYILFMALDETQCSNIPKMILKPYFNDLTRHDHQSINFFVHYQRPITKKINKKNEITETLWEEATEYWKQIPISYRLEKIPQVINTKTNNKCDLYFNGNQVVLQNKKNKLSQTINEEFNNLEGNDPYIFDVIRDGETQNIHATIPCTHDSRYDYTAFLQLIRLRLETIIWATNWENIFVQFLHFCDNDRSGDLTTRESRIAILTILRLIRDEDVQQTIHDTVFDIRIDWDDHEPTKCAHYLLPIPENAVSVDIHVFRALLVDALVYYMKITMLKFIRRHEEINMTLPMGNIWIESVEPCLEKIKLIINDKLMLSNLKTKKTSTSTHILQFTRNFLKEILILPVTVYKMTYKYLQKKRNHFQSILISIFMSFSITLWTLITIMNIIFFYYHSKQLKDNEENKITSIEIYFSLALLIYIILLDYIARMFQSLANERRKNLSVENSYRAAVYDLVRYQAQPTIVNSLPIENDDTDFTINLDENSDEEDFLASIASFSRNLISRLLLDRQHRILGIIIIILVSIHVCSPIIAREIVKKKNINKTSPYPWYAQFIVISYSIISFIPFLLYMIMMFRAFECFRNLYKKYCETLNSAYTDKPYIEQNEINIEYFNIKKSFNLDYFLMKQKRILGRSKTTRIRIHLFTVTFGFTICMVLLLISIIQILRGTSIDEFQKNPQNIAILIDLIIIALPVISILIVVSNINHASINELTELLQRAHVDAVRDEELQIENDDNEIIGRKIIKIENGLRYLKSSTEHIRYSFKEYQIRLFGVFIIDRSLVMKILLLAVSVAFSKLFKLLQEKV